MQADALTYCVGLVEITALQRQYAECALEAADCSYLAYFV